MFGIRDLRSHRSPHAGPRGKAHRSSHSATHFTGAAALYTAAGTNMKDEVHFAVNTNADSK
jgi:hypothetical protein